MIMWSTDDINMACMEDKQLRRTIEEALYVFPGVVSCLYVC